MRKDFDAEFGRTIYSFSERERIKLASFPFNGYLLRISMEKEVPHFELIEDILKILNSVRLHHESSLLQYIHCAHLHLHVEGVYVPLHQCIRCGLLYNCGEQICTKPFQHGRCPLCDS